MFFGVSLEIVYFLRKDGRTSEARAAHFDRRKDRCRDCAHLYERLQLALALPDLDANLCGQQVRSVSQCHKL